MSTRIPATQSEVWVLPTKPPDGSLAFHGAPLVAWVGRCLMLDASAIHFPTLRISWASIQWMRCERSEYPARVCRRPAVTCPGEADGSLGALLQCETLESKHDRLPLLLAVSFNQYSL